MAHQRWTWLTRRPTFWSAAVPLVALCAGVLFATSASTAAGTDLRSSAQQLPDVIREQTHRNAEAAVQVRNLQSDVDRLSASQAPGDVRVEQLTQQALNLSAQAGTREVRGPTVSVELRDAQIPSDQLPPGMTVDDIVVHQQDVQGVVNALWSGGAEAMMIMDQRVISTSAVRCVGNTLILQGRVYSPPFVITAMGDPTALRKALDDSPQVKIYKQYVDAIGLGYEVRTSPERTFPAYAGSVNLQYASVPK
ncbi:Uncharacterized conserved protein YlxW, UPF0749 family [Pedococcus cremeus]|uniref:Uncharacterized conserved protein YlxW, UPF0749 family n=1 Tax=Pedococcus cremeus TaxID=587636 RepID=A0A1H9XPH3_9MICO|nr:DUF881 domain-containing protein [Pedococcus cremeus]SES48056.1 Uncharacterized conserved protein YlxW, UPF0749 family [Pedococcus cremeus]